MNCQLSSVTLTQKDGRVTKLQNVYLRGNQIRFVVLPDILKNAPIFKRVQQIKQSYDKKKNPTGTFNLLGAIPRTFNLLGAIPLSIFA